MISRDITYVQAVDLYIGANVDWLSENDQPLVTSLYKAAEQLDKVTRASLLGEFRQVMRELHRRKPGIPAAQKVDDFDEFMKEFT